MAGLKVQPVNLFPEHLQRVGSLQFEAIVTNIRRGEKKRREEKRRGGGEKKQKVGAYDGVRTSFSIENGSRARCIFLTFSNLSPSEISI